MKEYILDANAVLRYFGVGDGMGGEKVRRLFEQAGRNEVRLSMSAVNLGEVGYVLLKHIGDERAMAHLQALQHAVAMEDATANRAMEAARLKHHAKIGYADSFAASLALELRGTLVSADPDFEKVGKGLKWMKLPTLEAKRR